MKTESASLVAARSPTACQVIVLALVCLLAREAGATLLEDNQYSYGAGCSETFDANISTAPGVLTYNPNGYLASVDNLGNVIGNAVGLNDGGTGSAFTFQGTATYNLNTSAYPSGYDITQIRSIHAWGDSATYSHQVYDLSVSYVGAPSIFILLTNVYYAVPGHEWEYGAGSANSTQVTLTDSTGTIATGAACIKVHYTLGAGSNEKQICREFMVTGAPSALPVNAAHSTVSPATATRTADGTSTQVITVQARDVNNNNLTSSGATLAFSATTGTVSLTSDNLNGTYTATWTSPTSVGSGYATVTATLGGTNVGTAVGASSCVITLTAGAANAAHSTVSPATATKTANGASKQLITVQARDANDNNLTSGGATVSFFATTGTVSLTSDNFNGSYTAEWTAPTSVGSGFATVTATLGGTNVGTAAGASHCVITLTNAVAGPVDATHSTLSPATATKTADGASTQSITVLACDASGLNRTNGGDTVVFSATAGTMDPTNATDHGDGSYTTTWTSPTSVGTGSATVTATLNGANVGTAVSASHCVITLTAGALDAAHSTVSPATATNVADGTSQQITVQARDVNNNNLTIGGATVAFSATTGTVSLTTDNLNGTYTATWTAPFSVGSGSATVTATLNGANVGTAVSASSCVITLTPGAANAAHSTVSPSTTNKTADGVSQQAITVQARDVNNNNLTNGGATVVFSATTGTVGLTTDNLNGTYTATWTAPTSVGSGSATVTATLGGSAVGTVVSASACVVTLTPGAANAAHSTVSPAAATKVADGVSTQSITVVARDVNNNTLTNGGATVAFSATAGTVGSVTDAGNGTYTATWTSPPWTSPTSPRSGTATVTATLGGTDVGTAVGASSCVITLTTLKEDDQYAYGPDGTPGIVTFFDANISTDGDLVYSHSVYLASVSPSGVGANYAGFNDGTAAVAFSQQGTMIYNLNTNVYPLGYDITQIRSINGYSGSAIYGHQVWDLYVSYVGAPSTFVLLKSVSYGIPGHVYEYGGGSGYWADQVTLTDSTGKIATRVACVKVQYNYTGMNNEGQIVREFMVGGAPTPVPTGAVILVR